MSEAERICVLKKECYCLHRFKDDPTKYEKAAQKLETRVTELKLNNLINPYELSFWLLTQAKPSHASPREFRRDVDHLLKLRKTSFFFQLSELSGFPDRYRLGRGKLLTFGSLPTSVKSFATNLTRGRVGSVKTELERIQSSYLIELNIPTNPNAGSWLEITESGIGRFIILENALRAGEESLDILRILNPRARIRLPRYAISTNVGGCKASFEPLEIELYKYFYDPKQQTRIDRLNSLCVKPCSDLEKRVLNALHFYRIGRNHSHQDQELFYYVAAIENLVIGENDRDVLKWKFSEKCAFLLEDDLNQRLEMVTRLKHLYDARSTVAHGRASRGDTEMILPARDYLGRIVMKILELIDKRGLRSVSPKAKKDGSSLDEYVDRIKYSGGPSDTKQIKRLH